jgi:AcrR family transcriptional regulator
MGTAGGKGAVTRAHVIDAARKCISELGYHRASSNEIARWAGVTWGVIQYHFGSREAVLLAIVDDSVADLESRLESADVSGSTAAERLAFVAEVVWSYYVGPYYLTYLEIYLNLTRDPEASRRARRRLTRIDAEITERWRAIAAKVFGSGDFVAVERLLFASLRGLAITRWLTGERAEMVEEREVLVEALTPLLMRSAG